MAAETQYTATTGVVTISTANSNLDGSTGSYSGTIVTGASPGTLIKSVIIKATGTTTQGMVRLFVTGGGTTVLMEEFEIPAVNPSTDVPSFEMYVPLNYTLKSGYTIKASTQNSETFNVVLECLDFAYYATSVRPESTNYTANTGLNTATAASTYYTILTPDNTKKGCNVKSIKLKSIVNTTAGMVRIYINKSSTHYLIKELVVTATTKSATAHSWSAFLNLYGNDYALNKDCTLEIQIQNAESTNAVTEGLDWTYPS
jgi:hypothetical protein